jgi:CheY-like chemotaxis protein
MMLSGLPTRLLYVEDDEDLRELIARVLVEGGYEVTPVASAETALEELGRTHFDGVLTDYNLPRENAAWLLEQARSRRYLEKTAVVVLTSERKPAGVDGHTVLQKPVDVAVLLGTLGDAVGQQTLPVSTAPPDDAPVELDLVLYVTKGSQESHKAIRNLHRVLKPYDPSRIRLTIFDVTAKGDEDCSRWLDEDRVIVTPTLVKKRPLPKTWIVGTLSPIGAVEDLVTSVLGAPGENPRAQR